MVERMLASDVGFEYQSDAVIGIGIFAQYTQRAIGRPIDTDELHIDERLDLEAVQAFSQITFDAANENHHGNAHGTPLLIIIHPTLANKHRSIPNTPYGLA